MSCGELWTVHEECVNCIHQTSSKPWSLQRQFLSQRRRDKTEGEFRLLVTLCKCIWMYKWNKWHDGGSSVSTSLYPSLKTLEIGSIALVGSPCVGLLFPNFFARSYSGCVQYGCDVVCMLYSGLLRGQHPSEVSRYPSLLSGGFLSSLF